MKTVDRKYIEMLRKYDSPTICNVIELFKVRPQDEGFLHHSIKALFPELPPMVGYAVTFTFTARKSKGTPAYNDIGKHVEALLAMPAPRVMVIQDMDDDPIGASFGELVAATYMAFGCVGIITSGGARDTAAIHKRKLPLFARSQNVSHGYPQYLDMNIPIKVGGVTIKPGDLLHGDADGVTTVPVDLAPRIALMGEQFIRMEREWTDYVDSNGATAKGISAILAKFGNCLKSAMEDVRRKVMES